MPFTEPHRDLTERVGFEPTAPILGRAHDFQSCPFNQARAPLHGFTKAKQL